MELHSQTRITGYWLNVDYCLPMTYYLITCVSPNNGGMNPGSLGDSLLAS